MARREEPVCIDLTLDDEEDDPTPSATESYGSTNALSLSRPASRQRSPLLPRRRRELGSSATAPAHAHRARTSRGHETSPVLQSKSFYRPPAKRQKTGYATKGVPGPQDLNRDLLNEYLETALCPKIEETIKELAPDFEGDWSSDFYFAVFTHATDHAFETEWVRNGYKISTAFELALHARIRQLVVALKNRAVRVLMCALYIRDTDTAAGTTAD
jgi:hypothetical protein